MSWNQFDIGDYRIFSGDGTVSLFCTICVESVDHDEPQRWPDGRIAPMTVTLDCVGGDVSIASVAAVGLNHHNRHHGGNGAALSAAASIIKAGEGE